MYHNHELFVNQEKILNANAVVIGPGPNAPNDAAELMSFIGFLVESKFPILGICLGQQAIGQFFGMNLTHGKLPMHGKTSEIQHNQDCIFNGINIPMKVGRYHSLIVEMTDKSNSIEPIASCEGEIMAIKHHTLPIYAVPFHPESLLTPEGQKLIQNWINLLG